MTNCCLSVCQRRVVDLQMKSTEVRKQLNVSADHLHQVNNDVWSMVQNSKEV